jgi:hypothetical protein
MNSRNAMEIAAQLKRAPVFLTTGQIAAIAGVSIQAVKAWVSLGKLQGEAIGIERGPNGGGKQRIFSKYAVEEFLREREARRRHRSRRR